MFNLNDSLHFDIYSNHKTAYIHYDLMEHKNILQRLVLHDLHMRVELPVLLCRFAFFVTMPELHFLSIWSDD